MHWVSQILANFIGGSLTLLAAALVAKRAGLWKTAQDVRTREMLKDAGIYGGAVVAVGALIILFASPPQFLRDFGFPSLGESLLVEESDRALRDPAYKEVAEATETVRDAFEQERTGAQISETVKNALSVIGTAEEHALDEDFFVCAVFLRQLYEEVEDAGRLIETESGDVSDTTRRSIVKSLSGYRAIVVEECGTFP